eukprot:gene12618-4458_t
MMAGWAVARSVGWRSDDAVDGMGPTASAKCPRGHPLAAIQADDCTCYHCDSSERPAGAAAAAAAAEEPAPPPPKRR